MGDGIPYLDIIFFAMVAGFILPRLRAVLGRRTGTEKPPQPVPVPVRDDKVIPMPERERPRETGSAGIAEPAGIGAIRRADPSFAAAEFLTGARAAYEMVVMAFASGDTEALQPLLAEPVYQGFAQAIAARKQAGQVMQTTLVGINEATIAEAAMRDRTAEVTVRFVADLINVTRDAQDKVVDGDPAAVKSVTDLWTFARDTSARDPNWQLVRTGE